MALIYTCEKAYCAFCAEMNRLEVVKQQGRIEFKIPIKQERRRYYYRKHRELKKLELIVRVLKNMSV